MNLLCIRPFKLIGGVLWLEEAKEALRNLVKFRKDHEHTYLSDSLHVTSFQNYAEALNGFRNWCVERGYLADDPLKRLTSFDTTPPTTRRAMTPEEIQRLLDVIPVHRRLLYEVAFTTGLRAGELRALTVDHLDAEGGGLELDATWTKNRKPGFQPLSAELVKRLIAFAESGEASELYTRFLRRSGSRTGALLYVPANTSRTMDNDIRAAGIPKCTSDGKIDFHACRVAYISFVVEAGATVKEAQAMARHSTPDLTMNTYARTREHRLSALAERVAETALSGEKCAHSVHEEATGTDGSVSKVLSISELGDNDSDWGAGTRTRKLRCQRPVALPIRLLPKENCGDYIHPATWRKVVPPASA